MKTPFGLWAFFGLLFTLSAANAESEWGWYDHVGNSQTASRLDGTVPSILLAYSGGGTAKTIETYLQNAKENGVKVILELPRKEVRAGQVGSVLDFVSQYKDQPALFGWYIADEPDLQKYDPAALSLVYRAVKGLSEKKVFITILDTGSLARYRDCADVFMRDNYPVLGNRQEFAGFQNGRFYRDYQTMANLVRSLPGKEPGFVIQAYGEDEKGQLQFNRRLPSAREMVWMVYSLELLDVPFTFLWTYPRARADWRQGVLEPLLNQLRLLSKGAQKIVQFRGKEGALIVWKKAGGTWVTAVNLTEKPQNLKTLPVAGGAALDSALLSGSQGFDRWDGTIPPYGVQTFGGVEP